MKYHGLFFIIIGIIGIIVSLLLMSESSTSYCIIGSACTSVVQSEYSHLLGIPLWLLALIGFTLYTALGFSYVFVNDLSITRLILLTILIGSGGASLLAFYLIYIELNILHLICSYCTILHALIFISFAFSVFLFKHY
jgi:uncharacterized membrane protein